jgi:DNA repair protein RadC
MAGGIIMNPIIKKALKIMETEAITVHQYLKSSENVRAYCRLQLAWEKEEVFAILFLDNYFGLLDFNKMFRGTINESSVHIRPIMRRIFELNAAKIIVCHNHPSGNINASAADIAITQVLKDALKLIDCPLQDHIIVSHDNTMSFAENSLL